MIDKDGEKNGCVVMRIQMKRNPEPSFDWEGSGFKV
jgi:hypothetical protein